MINTDFDYPSPAEIVELVTKDGDSRLAQIYKMVQGRYDNGGNPEMLALLEQSMRVVFFLFFVNTNMGPGVHEMLNEALQSEWLSANLSDPNVKLMSDHEAIMKFIATGQEIVAGNQQAADLFETVMTSGVAEFRATIDRVNDVHNRVIQKLADLLGTGPAV